MGVYSNNFQLSDGSKVEGLAVFDYFPSKGGGSPDSGSSPNGHVLLLQTIVISANLLIQILCITYVLAARLIKKGPFYVMLFVFSITITFRIIINMLALYVAMFLPKSEAPMRNFPIIFSLYVDYCSNLLSLNIAFLLSLNRCLSFTAKQWNYEIFESNRLSLTLFSGGIISIIGAMGIIIPAEVKREYVLNFGFLDRAADGVLKVWINRFFNLFPIGSIICYIILYRFLNALNRKITTPTVFLRKGEQRVFSQMIIISGLYMIMNIVYEAIVNFPWDGTYQNYIPWMQALAIANFLPEIALPFLFLLDALKIRKRVLEWLGGRRRKNSPVSIAVTSVT